MIQSKQIVSVIICAYNADSTIERTLISLENQDIGLDKFEIIIVDDGSTDSTKNIVETYITRGNIRLIYLYQKKTGVGVARNLGVANSSGIILAFTDADCVCDTNRISVIYSSIFEKGYKFIGGFTYSNGSIIYPRKIAPVHQLGITANLAFDFRGMPVKVFSGDFAGMFGEDTDLVLKFQDQGIALEYVEQMRVLHPPNILTFQQLLTRFRGRANDVLLFKRHRKRVMSSYSFIFQPRFFGRISVFAVAQLILLSLMIFIFQGFGFLGVFLFIVVLFTLFFIRGYKFVVIYQPTGVQITASDKVKTFLYLILITPLYFYYRIQGNIKFRFFMI